MKNSKICNQMMVKDSFRNKEYQGTMKCIICEEESNLPSQFPFYLEVMKNPIDAFMKLHAIKGCNKNHIK